MLLAQHSLCLTLWTVHVHLNNTLVGTEAVGHSIQFINSLFSINLMGSADIIGFWQRVWISSRKKIWHGYIFMPVNLFSTFDTDYRWEIWNCMHLVSHRHNTNYCYHQHNNIAATKPHKIVCIFLIHLVTEDAVPQGLPKSYQWQPRAVHNLILWLFHLTLVTLAALIETDGNSSTRNE